MLDVELLLSNSLASIIGAGLSIVLIFLVLGFERKSYYDFLSKPRTVSYSSIIFYSIFILIFFIIFWFFLLFLKKIEYIFLDCLTTHLLDHIKKEKFDAEQIFAILTNENSIFYISLIIIIKLKLYLLFLFFIKIIFYTLFYSLIILIICVFTYILLSFLDY